MVIISLQILADHVLLLSQISGKLVLNVYCSVYKNKMGPLCLWDLWAFVDDWLNVTGALYWCLCIVCTNQNGEEPCKQVNIEGNMEKCWTTTACNQVKTCKWMGLIQDCTSKCLLYGMNKILPCRCVCLCLKVQIVPFELIGQLQDKLVLSNNRTRGGRRTTTLLLK